MKTKKTAALVAILSTLPVLAAVPLRWTVETSRLQPAVFDIVRGETLALEASFKSYGKDVSTSNMTACLCWQTNGMENAWWTTNAVTTATVARVLFTPEMDPGAPTVSAFIGLSDTTNASLLTHSSSLSYRAAFTLRFRHGPGARPNVIEQPPKVLDLAHTVVVNPPWPTAQDFAATTTVMRAELKDYVDDQIEGAGVVSPQVVSNIVEDAVGDNSTLVHGEKIEDTDIYDISVMSAESATYAQMAGIADSVANTYWETGDHPTTISGYGITDAYKKDDVNNMLEGVVKTNSVGLVEDTLSANNFATPGNIFRHGAHIVYSVNGQVGEVTLDIPSTNGFVKASVTNDVAAEVRGNSSQLSTLGQGYTRIYNFITGATNANFTATNYPPNAAAAAAKFRYQPEPGMDFTDVPASLQLNERRDGAWRTVMDTRDWTAWYFRFKEQTLTNEIAKLKAENAALSNRLVTVQAWANFTADGVENPMTDTTVVDRPNLWLMADYEWQKCVSGSNSCWVIRAKNVALSGGANTNGFLEICDAFGKPYMRVNKSAETFADPDFESIAYDDDEGAWYVVFGNTQKPNKGGANCEIVGATSGGGRCILYDEDDPDCPATITWPDTADSHAGHWIMKAVPKPVGGVVPTRMFFGAEIKVPGKDYVEYVKEASFGAGIRVGNNVYEAVESGNTLIWQKKVE